MPTAEDGQTDDSRHSRDVKKPRSHLVLRCHAGIMAAVARDLHLAARIMAVRAAILATLLGRTTASGMGAFVPKFLGLGLLGNGFGVHFALRYLGTTRLCDAPAILEDGAG